jgi:hypothetical protein
VAKKKPKSRSKLLSPATMLKCWRRKRIVIEISYRGEEWQQIDKGLKKLARRYKGRPLGSGMFIPVGVRDTSFEFDWPEFGGSAVQMLANVRAARPIFAGISKKKLPGVVSFLNEAEELKTKYPKMEIRCAITFHL